MLCFFDGRSFAGSCRYEYRNSGACGRAFVESGELDGTSECDPSRGGSLPEFERGNADFW